MEKIYIILARRWGNIENHSYICGWTDDFDEAKKIANAETIHRGRKYAGVVYECLKGWVWSNGNLKIKEVYRSLSSQE